MLAGFALIGLAARQEWHEERFSALYLEQTLEGAQEASILFADLQGFHALLRTGQPRGVHACSPPTSHDSFP